MVGKHAVASLLTALVVVSATPCAAQATPEELLRGEAEGRDTFLPDFSYAGYGFGLAPLPQAGGRELSVAEFGALPDDDKDDSAALKAALEAAGRIEGPIRLVFAPGRYLVTEILPVTRSDLVLQGTGGGEGGTELHFPRPLAMVETGERFEELREYLKRYEKRQREPDNNLDVLFSEYSWTGGFVWVGREGARAVPYLEELDRKPEPIGRAVAGERGALSLRVEDPAAFSADRWIEIAWFAREGRGSGIIDEIYGETDLEIGSHHWSFEDRPLVRHRTKVVSVEDDVLTLASPLPHPVSESVAASILAWEPLVNVGLEDMALTFPEAAVFGHHVERGYNGVYFTGAADGWMRNVTIRNADAGVLTDDSAYLTFRDLVIEGSRKGHYAVHMGAVQNVLVSGLDVFNPVIHSLTFNTKSTRSVYQHVEVWRQPVIDQHAGANHQNLYDDVTLHLTAAASAQGPSYPVFDGSGAGYWQPGHGRYNTVWNMKLIVEGGAAPGTTLNVLGLAEGPDARIVGLHANRPITLDYRPQPLTVSLGQPVESIPSLYEHQLAARRERAEP